MTQTIPLPVGEAAAASGIEKFPPGPLSERAATWERIMLLALSEARIAMRHDDVPVGAVIVGPDGTLLAAAHNMREEHGDPTAHAEILAIQAAAARLNEVPIPLGDSRRLTIPGVPQDLNRSMVPVPLGESRRPRSGAPASRNHGDRDVQRPPSAPERMRLETTGIKKEWRLTGCTLVVTLEPCVMCAGAILAARMQRVVFGAWGPKAGACGSVWDLVRDAAALHQVEVVPNVLAPESELLLRDFFQAKRSGG